MRKIITLLGVLGLLGSLKAQMLNPDYLRYIETWKETAVNNQTDYGVPASIIMAQALLESAAGKSELALKANNHFGIKCTNEWMGAVYYYDDDAQGECFRKYANAAESFKDHALFLQRPRYATCFEIAVEDYEGWARRLKECGYATDKLYAPKLIKLIEDYRLDTLFASYGKAEKKVQEPLPQQQPQTQSQTPTQTQADRPLKAAMVTRTEPIMVINKDPEPPYVEPLTAKQEKDSFFLMHPKNRVNGVTYVVAREEDTFANVAFRLNVRERDLRVNNDALGRELRKGDRIFIYPKKTTGTENYVWVAPGTTLWQFSQEVGVQIQAIQKLNGLNPAVRTFNTRQKIYLRKVKEQ